MRFLVLFAGLFVSFNSQAGLSYRYKCECIDTGAECDGIDTLSILLQEDRMIVQAKDREGYEGTRFEAKFDPRYRPIKYKNFDRYLITDSNNKDYPYFLVNKGISKSHWNKGPVKLIEKNAHHGYGWTWEFDCRFDRRAAPLIQ